MKPEKRIIWMMLGALCGLSQVSAQDQAMILSLKQAIELGIKGNTNVLNARLERQKTAYKLEEAQSNLYPQVEAYSNFNYYYAIPRMVIPGEIFGQTGPIPVEIGTKFDWSSGFKATQVLYNQSYITSLELAKRMAELDGLALQQQQEEVAYQVSQVYYLCQTTRNQIAQLETTMAATDRLLEITKLQKEAGVIRSVDYSRVSVNKSNLQTQIDDLEELYQRQLGLLKYLIGLDSRQEVELADSLTFSPVKSVYAGDDFNNRTELRQLDRQLETTALTRKMNRQAYLPTLSAFGQYYYQGMRNEFDFFRGGEDKFFKVGVVGLSLTIPLFDGFEKRSRNRQYDITLMQLKNTRENTLAYFSKEYTDAINQYENSYTALLRQQENIKVAEEAYGISLQGYQQQVVSLADLLLSESGLTEARLSYYNALMKLKTAELEVKKAKGELLSQQE